MTMHLVNGLSLAVVCAAVLGSPRPVSAQAPPEARVALDQLTGQLRQLAQAAPDTAPIVKVGLFRLRQDGATTQGSAYSTADSDQSIGGTVHVSSCSMGGGRRAPMLAGDVWAFDGRVTMQTAEQAVLQLTWRRERAMGQDTAQPPASIEITLRPGDRVPLDAVTPSEVAGCPVGTVSFEARFEPRSTLGGAGGVARVGGGSSGGVGGVANVPIASAGGSAGSASGGVAVSGAGSGGGGGGVGGRIGAVRVGGGMVTGVRGTTAQHALKAEVWLVHSAPGRQDEVLHTETVATSGGGDFAFPPVVITLPAGTLNVRVSGITELGAYEARERQFAFSATRRVAFTPASGAARDTSATANGSTKSIGPVPGPEEVVSYEMPPIQIAGAGEIPDRFSLRVRLTPVQIPQ
jgi:hypothetical protein